MSSRLRALSCGLLLLMWFPPSARAAAPSDALVEHSVTTWSQKDGLPPGRIRALAHDADGYLWVGTDTGLIRFDGVRFFPWETLGGQQLPEGNVQTLLSSKDGSLWVGMGGAGGIGRIRNGQLTIYNERQGLGTGYIASLIEDHEGTIWAASRAGLYRFRNDRWGRTQGLPAEPVVSAFEDSKDRLWIATVSGVLRRMPGNATFEQLSEHEIAGNQRPQFSEDASGEIWITDIRQGFRRLSVPARLDPAPGAQGWGVKLLHDRRGNLWVATQGQGLWRVRPVDGAPHFVIDIVDETTGLSSDAVQSLLEDRERNIWVGTNAGLQRFSPLRVKPLTDLGFARTIEVTRDGSVWVGTSDGLTEFSPTDRRRYGVRQGLPGSIVQALHTDKEGVLWVSTDKGLARWNDGKFSPITFPPGQNPTRVFSISTAHGAMWFRDIDRGLMAWRDGKIEPPEEVPEIFRKVVFTIYTDRRGDLWLGSSNGGLGVLRRGKRFQSYDLGIGNVVSLYEDSTNTLWVGGSEGMSRFQDERFVTVTRSNRFPAGVLSVADDESGFVWAGLGAGIARFERSEFAQLAKDPHYQVHYRLFDTSDGVAGGPVKIGTPNVVRGGDGRLWFVTSSGVTVVDPRNLGQPRMLPPVRIETITADATRLSPTPDLQLPARTAHLQIVFTALTLADRSSVSFRYRLDGFDEDWVEAGMERQVTYTNLAPGGYRFRVVAGNNDGVWTDPGATWQFSVLPTFYQTGWFYSLSAIAVTLAVWGSWRFRVRQVRHEFALVLAERIRMSRAIHDTLLQGLVGIALQLDDLSHSAETSSDRGKDYIARIRRQVEEYVREARNSIWDLRSPRLEERDLATALREVGNRAISGTSVQFRATIDGVPHKCPPRVEEHLFLIGQEALNNAVRHAHARRIHLELHFDPQQIRLRVSDDGSGFDLDVAHQTGGHYGLLSMRERVEQIRGRLEISTGPGRGTAVEAVIPISSS